MEPSKASGQKIEMKHLTCVQEGEMFHDQQKPEKKDVKMTTGHALPTYTTSHTIGHI